MRHLTQPKTLLMATIAAAVTALACYPRLALWQNRQAPVPFLEFIVFLSSIVLWGFVFAWHEPYTGRPILNFKWPPKLFVSVTLAAILVAAAFYFLIDPPFRSRVPDEYPADTQHWFAMVLFSMFLNQLFVLFAPFDWMLRLAKNQRIALVFAILFGAFVLVLKLRSLPTPLPFSLLLLLLTGKIIAGILTVVCYLRGGILLVWWWTIIFEARNLLNFL